MLTLSKTTPAKQMTRPDRVLIAAIFALLLAVQTVPVHAQLPDFSDEPQGRVLNENEMLLAGVEANRLDVVVYLLNKGLDPNATARNGYTALMVAAGRGHEGIIDFLLSRGADVNKTSDSGWTALMEAARRDQDRTIEKLVKAGAKVDAVEKANGQTPLIIAAKSERLESVTALIKAGADLALADASKGLTALHHALASTKGSSAEIAAELLVRGADPERAAKDGYTPLMSAIDSGQVAKLSLVLSESVEVNAETKDGRTALTIASGLGLDAAVKRLLKAGAQVDIENDAYTALTQAARVGSDETVLALLEAGANPNRAARDSRKPLMLAARGGFDDAVKALVEKGAKVNGRNKTDGSTALMWAANNGFRSIVEYLVEQGADASITAKDGWTAGEAARMAGHTEIADKLEQRI